MNTKKILILVVLFVAVAGMTISTVSAKTCSKTVKFKDSTGCPVNKCIGKGEYISTFYNSKYSGQFDKKRAIFITIGDINDLDYNSKYKMISSKVKFSKKVNGETKTYSKTYKPNKWGSINTQAPIGWKPYSAVVKYKNI